MAFDKGGPSAQYIMSIIGWIELERKVGSSQIHGLQAHIGADRVLCDDLGWKFSCGWYKQKE